MLHHTTSDPLGRQLQDVILVNYGDSECHSLCATFCARGVSWFRGSLVLLYCQLVLKLNIVTMSNMLYLCVLKVWTA